ncbi:sulfite exporter TauE/SafE family protein [Magnetofaba australis]|uniref:Putative cytochrome c biogenesis protein, transmembrane region n=1 Tax=Magnetofaba australis IT-1 TaxID=1434232 RepID=A0A1Y2K8L8_9PROT|nr:sulfite exporter TauE/SafE family protein [Magnetofaba australis]OSM07100.1 putative cytochrome c biogenesis protein, transmembrane region [Magnetofaba australis IT-1]
MPPLAFDGALSLASAWILGLSTGLTLCALSCVPAMGSWALARAGGGLQALGDTVLFLAGRVTGYTLLAGGAAWLGQTLLLWREAWPVEAILGVALIASGMLLAWPRRSGQCAGSHGRRGESWPPFFLGLSLSLIPCPPLAALLSASANAADWLHGALLGGAFGVGAALSPVLLIAPLFGLFGKSLTTAQPWLARWTRLAGAAALVALGVARLLGGGAA